MLGKTQRLVIDLDAQRIVLCGDSGESIVEFAHAKAYPDYSAETASRRLRLRRMSSDRPFSTIFNHHLVLDHDAFIGYMEYILRRASIRKVLLGNFTLLLATPARITALQKEALAAVFEELGFDEVIFCPRVLAAAVGGGFRFPLQSPAVVCSLTADESEITLLHLVKAHHAMKLPWSHQEMLDAIAAELLSKGEVLSIPEIEAALGRLLHNPKQADHESMHTTKRMRKNQQSSTTEEVIRNRLYRTYEDISVAIEFFFEKLDIETYDYVAQHGLAIVSALPTVDFFCTVAAPRLRIPVYPISGDQPVMSGLLKIARVLEDKV